MAIAYIDPSNKEPVDKEPWRWVVIYHNGLVIEQFAIESGRGAVFHPFKDIDHSKVKVFKLVHDTLPAVIAHPPEGAKLIHGYTTRIAQHLTDDGEHMYTETYRGYKFGYQLDGRDYGVFVDHDNTIQVIQNFKNIIVAPDK